MKTPALLARDRLAILLLALATACAPPRPRLPEPEDFRKPTGAATADQAEAVDRAWNAIVSGDRERARKQIDVVREDGGRPALVNALEGWMLLRTEQAPDAYAAFQRALTASQDDLSALIGAALAAQRAGDLEAAHGYLRRASALAPTDPIVAKRLPEVRLAFTERRVTAGREALAAGQATEAIEQYRLALATAPELAGLRLELAELMLGQQDRPGAIAVLEADTEDRQVALRLGALHTEANAHARALAVYRRMLARDPTDTEVRALYDAAARAAEMAGMPEEYRRIPSAARISRADLAALIAIKVPALARVTPAAPEVVTDIGSSWAREHILKGLSYDLFDVFPNHTFQPGSAVRRGDLARAVGRVLELLRTPLRTPPQVTDLAGTNRLSPYVRRTLAAGLMEVTATGAFEPWKPVSGEEAMRVVDALARAGNP